MRAAEVLGLEVCPTPIRTRALYQNALRADASRRTQANAGALSEIAALVDLIERRLYPEMKTLPEAIAL